MKPYATYCAACAVLLGLILGTGFARAQEPTSTGAVPAEKPQSGLRKMLRNEVKETRTDAREEKKAVITETRARNDEIRAENKELLQKPKENKTFIKENRAEIKGNRKDARGEIKALRASSTEAIKERRKENLQEKLGEKARANAIKHFGKALSKLTGVIERVNTLIMKVDSRLAKFAEKGVDTSESSALIVKAKEKSTAATAALEKAKAEIKIASSTDATQGTAENVRASLKEAETNVREAHRFVVDAVNSLKPGQNRVKTSPVSTTTDAGASAQ